VFIEKNILQIVVHNGMRDQTGHLQPFELELFSVSSLSFTVDVSFFFSTPLGSALIMPAGLDILIDLVALTVQSVLV
jgi:hypothetical protein